MTQAVADAADTPAAVGRARRLWPHLAALGVAVAGGALCRWAGAPLAWMMGAMVAVAVLAAAKGPVAVDRRVRDAGLAVIGTVLGCAFLPSAFASAAHWGPSFAVMLVSQLAMGAVAIWGLVKFGGFEPRAAFLAGVPGTINQCTAMAEEHQVDPRQVSLTHGVRVMVVVVGAPLLLAATGMLSGGSVGAGAGAVAVPALEATWRDYALLALAPLAGPAMAKAWRLPTPTLLGPIIISALLHATGATAMSVPSWLAAAAQVGVGAAIGARFVGVTWRDAGRTLRAAAPAALFMLIWSAAAAYGFGKLVGWDYATALLILTPGGLAESGLIALAVGLDATPVTTHHVARIAVNLATVPMLFALWTHWRNRAQKSAALA